MSRGFNSIALQETSMHAQEALDCIRIQVAEADSRHRSWSEVSEGIFDVFQDRVYVGRKGTSGG